MSETIKPVEAMYLTDCHARSLSWWHDQGSGFAARAVCRCRQWNNG